MENALQRIEPSVIQHQHDYMPLPMTKIVERRNYIRSILKEVFVEGEHYGYITGKKRKPDEKPTLRKSGAEMLGNTFQIGRRFEEKLIDLPNGHREVIMKCILYALSRPEIPICEGHGSCSTLESKYRFRTENLQKAPPEEWWKDKANKALIGGADCNVEKKFNPFTNKSEWVIVKKVEHDNPADYFNTVIKISEKRSYVGAILSALGCADMFTTEDEEEPAENDPPESEAPQNSPSDAPETRTRQTPKAKAASAPAAAQAPNSAPAGDWENVVIHWTKNKGQTLGELKNDSLAWYAGKGDQGWKLSARATEQDKSLQAAAGHGLKVRLGEIATGFKNKPEPAAQPEAPNDDVPF